MRKFKMFVILCMCTGAFAVGVYAQTDARQQAEQARIEAQIAEARAREAEARAKEAEARAREAEAQTGIATVQTGGSSTAFSVINPLSYYDGSFGLVLGPTLAGEEYQSSVIGGMNLRWFFSDYVGLGTELLFGSEEWNYYGSEVAFWWTIDLLFRAPLSQGFFLNFGIGFLLYATGAPISSTDDGFSGLGYTLKAGLEIFLLSFESALQNSGTPVSFSIDLKYKSWADSSAVGSDSWTSLDFGLNFWF